jgi:hypothetical protein
VTTLAEPLPDLSTDLAAAHAMIIAERAGRLVAQAQAEEASAARHNLDIEIERLKL